MDSQSDRSESRSASGLILIVLTLFSWSSVPLFLRYFAGYLDGWTANGWRYGISAIFWAPVVIVGLLRRTLPRGLWIAAIVPSAFNCVAQSMFAWAPYFIEPGLLTFMLRSHIVFVTLGAYLLFPSERFVLRTKEFWIGIVIVFLGAAGVLLLGDEPPRGATAIGVFLGLASGALYAGYALSVRYYMHEVHPIVAFSAISLLTAAVLVSTMLVAGKNFGLGVTTLSGGQLLLLTASAFIGIAFSHAMYYAGIVRLGVSMSSGIILLQPILTSIASFFLFDERLAGVQWFCGLASLCGAGVLLAAQRKAAGVAKVDTTVESDQDAGRMVAGVLVGEKA